MGNKGVHTFFKGICVKVNVIVQLESELAYYNVAVQHISHNAMGTLPYVTLLHLLNVLACFSSYKFKPLTHLITFLNSVRTSPCSIIAQVLDYNLEVNNFELQSLCYVQFWTNILGKGMDPFSPRLVGWFCFMKYQPL